MKEIGSEFWNVPILMENNSIFSSDMDWFLSGRGALKSIIDDIMSIRKIHTVAMPSWCCDSMIIPFIERGISPCFYPVYFDNNQIRYEVDCAESCDAVFLIDYFGYRGYTIKEKLDGVVIRDVTHSIFSRQYSDADYYFGSLRKWAGFWTGGYAWTREGHRLKVQNGDDLGYSHLREEAMLQKKDYINHVSDSNCNIYGKKIFLEMFSKAESALELSQISPAKARDIELAKQLDVELIKQRRRSNAKCLLKRLSDVAIFKQLDETDCPMFVPIYVSGGKRDMLKRVLISKGIYCPVHWPITKHHTLHGLARALYDEELSIVCDQRYNEEDMERIVDVIKLFYKDERLC